MKVKITRGAYKGFLGTVTQSHGDTVSVTLESGQRVLVSVRAVASC